MFLRNVMRKIASQKSLNGLAIKKNYFGTTSSLLDDFSINANEKTGVSVITMSKTPANSLNLEFIQELSMAIQKLNMEKSCRGIILTSSLPSIFSAGLDILEMYQPEPDRLEKFWTEFQEIWLALYSSPKTVMSAINGHSPAGGCIIALATDYRIMKPKFTIGLNETMLGIVAPFWAEDSMKAVIGQRRSEYSLQLGKLYTAEEALQINLIDEISDNPLQACEDEMMNWLKLPDHARTLTKFQNRGHIIEKMKKGRKEDLEKFVKFIPREGIQMALGTYLDNLKSRKKKQLKTCVSDVELIVRKIKYNLEDYTKTTFFYLGAQDGILAENLINSGCKKVIVTEHKKSNEEHLNEIQNRFREKFLRFTRFPNSRIIEEYKLDGLEEKNWHTQPKVAVILTLLTNDRSKLSLNSYLLRKQFPFNFGRTPIFLLTDNTESKVILMNETNLQTEKRIPSRALSYMFLYDRTLLAEIPRLKPSQKYTKLIKIQPKSDLVDLLYDEDKFKEAEVFLKHFFNKPYERVIPKIEKICPNLGSELIDMNITMLDRVKDLDFRIIGEIFRLVASNDNYSRNIIRVLSSRHEF
ncbi:DgyrCDS4176 [Dimorphilus gyrociliatus]|uniref:Enoyl-CoA delta isomerase 1, mitochondrial n=1 Tax=Dimorphilus gyrociliatus TaxID=2664684 RepID=A0A7I8VIT5_9ANNE|nr:DgyrCDS4176 [Dimorphilus gyrociliatus]